MSMLIFRSLTLIIFFNANKLYNSGIKYLTKANKEEFNLVSPSVKSSVAEGV